ncbi:MAG: tetratricopeptide repeat protein, partial [Chloroflexi bacterium]|nr:tetratricopeptide repeat protein [Chloroflexota bacterium]
MSNYEFWDELGKIFNAVVAYQEKSIEFNKRFINPWIRLGNVFEKQDRHKEAIEAYKKAIELDPGNAENWYELGNAYFQSEAYDQAADAFNRAIELNPQFGWAYSNLALALTTQGKHAEAIPLFQIGVDLVEEDKDKAVIWNRLGNAYRKLNEYGLAVQAFQKADELDSENAGFRDELDEAEEGPSLVEGSSEAGASQPADLNLSPIQLIVEESHAEEAASVQTEAVETPAPLPEVTEVVADVTAVADPQSENQVSTEDQLAEPQAENATEAVAESTPSEAVAQTEPEAAQPTDQPATEIAVAENAEQNIEAVAEATEQPVEAVSEATETAVEQSASEEAVTVPIAARKETVTVAVQTTVETFTDSLSVTNTSTETIETLAATDVIAESAPQTEETPATESEPKAEAVESTTSAVTEETSVEENVSEETVEVEASQPESIPSEAEEVQTEPPTPVSEVKVIDIEEETIIISEAAE